MKNLTFERTIVSVFIITLFITCALALSGNTAYAAEKEPGRIVTGTKHLMTKWEDLGDCDMVDKIEIDMFPYGLYIQSTVAHNSRADRLILNKNIKYEFHKDDSMFELVETNSPCGAIQIKKAGKIVVTVTKPATKTEEAVTKDVTITVVDKRFPSKITGVKSKYVKTYGDKSFTLNAVQSNYNLGLDKYMTYEDWKKYSYAEFNEFVVGNSLCHEVYRYPWFSSDNKDVATVDSKGKVTLKKPGKATITIKVKLVKQKNWEDIDGDPGRYRNIPAVKKVTVIVKPKTREISKVSKVNSDTMKVSWAKKSYVKGYRIKYCTNSKFIGAKYKTVSSAKLSDTVSGLKKGKTYYVKVAAYTTTKDGKKIYGNWSDAKTVTI